MDCRGGDCVETGMHTTQAVASSFSSLPSVTASGPSDR